MSQYIKIKDRNGADVYLDKNLVAVVEIYEKQDCANILLNGVNSLIPTNVESAKLILKHLHVNEIQEDGLRVRRH